MTQEDIDRLLICRAAVDKQRAFNAARVEAYTTCKSVTKAKALIESKTGVATSISADSSTKPPQAIKTVLEEERTKSTLAMLDVLKDAGFESVSAFGDWNDKMNFQAFKDCCPVVGTCDYCGEDAVKEQNCVLLYGVNNCAVRTEELGTDGVYAESFKRYKAGNVKEVNGVIATVSVCPAGHGFYNDVKNFKAFPFDVLWRV